MIELCARLMVLMHVRMRQFHQAKERGDVPGWVMVTVMTAGLVVAIFAVFSEKIKGAVSNAIDQVVTGTNGSGG